jgi:hypothetical protein
VPDAIYQEEIMDNFQMPELTVGDMVLFFDNPFSPQEGSMGWVASKPGTQTISVLVYAQNTGLVEKPSVRHADDPFWKNSETAAAWGRWGCFRVHPSTTAIKEIHALLTKSKIEAARNNKKVEAA